jgi:TetR/AcrR family transcriptional repressor of nem operon
MGRPVSYRPQEVIRRALELFNARAFHSISIQDLVEATSLNRFAIYEKFGGKRELLLQRLRANNQNPDIPVGCIVVNASLEFGGRDKEIERIHEACRTTLRRGFARALQRAEDAGELAPGRPVAERAEYLQTMISAFMALQHVSRAAAEDLMRATVDEVSSWRRSRASVNPVPDGCAPSPQLRMSSELELSGK